MSDFLIDGELVPPVEPEMDEIIAPATGKVLTSVPIASVHDVDLAVKAARKAWPSWSATPPGERAGALLKLADRIDEHAEELAQLESADVGKPLSLAREEIPFISDNLRFFAGAARCLEGRAAGEYAAGFTSIIRRESIGVVASIAPWNYPLMMAIWKIGPALAAGNSVVLKPAELTPLTTLRLGELARELLPPGVLNVINGYGRSVGHAMTCHPEVDMVSLTGDVSTGKTVAKAAADSLKRTHLELGGKAPVIIFDDADLEHAVATIRFAGLLNTGQDCTAACRIYAQKSVHDRLVEQLIPALESVKIAPLDDPECEMGPLVSEAQRQRVVGFLERTRGEIVTGGTSIDGPGFHFQPTLVTRVDNTDEIVLKEVFGPVITVTPFDTPEQVVGWANGVDYGLASSVWTQNLDRALECSRLLRFGTVWINDHATLVSEMPHGGYKQSGYGKDMSGYALEDYTDIKHVMIKVKGF